MKLVAFLAQNLIFAQDKYIIYVNKEERWHPLRHSIQMFLYIAEL
jgi:hypothetical protein